MLTVYDKSLEAITGGSNVGADPREFLVVEKQLLPRRHQGFDSRLAGESAPVRDTEACKRSVTLAMMIAFYRQCRRWRRDGA